MYKFYPYFTNDGSVGLYSPSDQDIYHSTYGALTEAYEKFIFPAEFENYFKKNSEIKLLDICFGIGYNTKSFLNYFFEIFEKKVQDKNYNIATIHTDNIFNKISVTCIDTDKILIFLSPFIKTDKKINKKNKLSFSNEKISRLLNESTKINYKIEKFVKIIFLIKIVENCPEIFQNGDLIQIISDKNYSEYFDADIIRLFKFLRNQRYKSNLLTRLNAFLHNIYYKYLSTSYKKALKYLKLCDINFNIKTDDARTILKEDKLTYDYVFLDAFTPTKCPCLWTVDFFKLLHERLNPNGMILTYSNSASIRNAIINAELWVGKTYDEKKDKFIGTVAAKDLSLIKNGLSEYDLGLIKSKAGIFYRDENLNLNNDEIIAQHEIEVATSNLMSSSKFIRKYRGVK